MTASEYRACQDLQNQVRDYDAAVAAAELCLSIVAAQFGRLSTEHATSLNNLAGLYEAMGSYEKAEPLYLEAKEIRAQTLGQQHPSYATSLGNLALLYKSMGSYEKAEPLFLEAKEIRAQTLGQQHHSYAASLSNLAGLYKDMGSYEKAEPLFLEAKEITAQTLGQQHPSYAASLNNLAVLYEAMGSYEKAEPLYLEAKEIQAQTLGQQHPSYAASLGNLAGLYKAMGSYEKAEPLYLEAKEIKAQTLGQQHPSYATSLNNLAGLYVSMGSYEKAEPLYLEAKEIRAQTLGQQHPDYATSLNNLAVLYEAMGSYEKAEPLFLEAKEIRARTLGQQHPDYATSLNNLAGLYQAMGSYEKAEPLFLEAKEITAQTLGKQHPDYAGSLHNLAVLYEAMGSHKVAFAYAEEASIVFFQLLTVVLLTLTEKRMLQYIHTADFQVGTLISILISGNFDVFSCTTQRCYGIVGSVKNIVLDAQMQQLEFRKDLKSSNDNIRQLSQARWTLTQAILSDTGTSHPAIIKEDKIQTLVDQIDRLISTGARARQLHNFQSPLKVQTHIAKYLPDNSALVDYVLYRDSYVVFIILPQPHISMHFHFVGKSEELDKRLRDFLKGSQTRILRKRKRHDLRAQGQMLRSQLLDPVMKLIGPDARHLFVVPDGALALLPFAILPAVDDGYVLDWNVNISYLSSSRDLLRESEYREHAPLSNATKCAVGSLHEQPSLVIGNPDYGAQHFGRSIAGNSSAQRDVLRGVRGVPSFEDLPNTRYEAEQVAGMLSKLQGALPLLLMGKAATVSALQSAQSPPILHIATHGFFLPVSRPATCDDLMNNGRLEDTLGKMENPMLRSGLAFAGARAWQEGSLAENGDAGIMTALDICSMNLHGTKLAVLSACESGLGDLSRGQGVSGLGRSLMLAGAKCTLLSLWNVGDASTAELMVKFYSESTALDSEAFAEALRAAQRVLRSRGLPPRDWGAFVLYTSGTAQTFHDL